MIRAGLLTLAVSATMFVTSANAQFWGAPYPSPYYPPAYYPQPAFVPMVIRYSPGIQTMGYLPNGTRVINPWGMYDNQNYNGVYWVPTTINPYAYSPYGYGGYSPYLGNPYPTPTVNREPGRFVPVARDLAINPISGTRIAPARGIALTNEGAFYRIPGTGSITPWGAVVPGSGEYYNPITGTLYNPASGIIVRP